MEAGAARGQTMARISELLAIPDVIGSQTDPSPEVTKASYAQEAALKKRDAEVFKLARELIDSRDAAAAEFLLNQVRANPERRVAGELALALAGVTEHSDYMAAAALTKLESAAPPEVLSGLAELFLSHQPIDIWLTGPIYLNTLFWALPNFWNAGALAILLTDREHAARRLQSMLAPAAVAKLGTQRRFEAVMHSLASLEPSREIIELLVATLTSLARSKQLRSEWTSTLTGFVACKGQEAELAHLLELDCDPMLLSASFQLVAGPRDCKRVLPAVATVAERIRNEPAGLERLKVADEAMNLKGALLTGDTKKIKPPRAPPRVKFKSSVGTDGGPILALPKEAAKEWRGVLRADGSVPTDGNFAGTDYQRACDVFGGTGFIVVGTHRALVLGEQGCSTVLPKEGGCLLVLAGDEETVFAALKAEPKWKSLNDSLTLTGELLLFDAAMEHAKTGDKTTLKLPAGRYAVEQLGDVNHSPWIVRLVPT
jgi:hypothetical protein